MPAIRQSYVALAAALLTIGGCHKPVTAVAAPPPAAAVKQDPVEVLYQNMKEADTKVDIAVQDLEDAMNEATTFAPKAGGDAKQALLNVADLLNSAGQDLSEYQDVPETIEAFRKDFAAQDEHRLNAIDAAIQALKSVQAANLVLDDLDKNVPAQGKQALDEIAGNCDDAASGLQVAIKKMGGKIPKDEDDIDTGTDTAESGQ